MIKFQNVSKVYKENAVLSDVNLTIQQGEFFVLVGPSGSGKTTTLKMINRLIEPTTGEVALNEQAVTNYPLRELRLKIGYVLQQIALFPNLTVAENIELIPEMKKWPKEQRRERTIELLKKFSWILRNICIVSQQRFQEANNNVSGFYAPLQPNQK